MKGQPSVYTSFCFTISVGDMHFVKIFWITINDGASLLIHFKKEQ